MQSCLKCNNTSLKMLSHLAIQCSGSDMSKSFNYIFSKLKLDTMSFCSVESNNFYEMVQEGLDEQLIRKVHLQKMCYLKSTDVCSTSFLFIDESTVLCTQ